MADITFAHTAWEQYCLWQQEDRKTAKKINLLLQEICRTPFEGMGKPEPLKGSNGKKWSRRINDKDRIVYSVCENKIIVLQCKGHYDDK